jgi:hypothetical protein
MGGCSERTTIEYWRRNALISGSCSTRKGAQSGSWVAINLHRQVSAIGRWDKEERDVGPYYGKLNQYKKNN